MMQTSRRPTGLLAATRAVVLPLGILPVLVGSAYAWTVTGEIQWMWLGLALLGAGALHLGANVVNDVYDIRSGVDELAEDLEGSIRTGSPEATPGLAVSLFGAAAACGVVLALYRGPLVLAYGAIGALLAFFYVAPPIALGYRGRGLGELAILIAFGPLPVVGAYYVQTAAEDIPGYVGPLSSELLGAPLFVWLLGVLPGLFTMMVLYSHHFLHHTADRTARKMTPVAAWGPEFGLKLIRPMVGATIAALIALIGLQILPWWAASAGPPLVLLWTAVRRAEHRKDLRGYMLLLRAAAVASIAGQSLLVVSLLLAV